MTMTMTTTTRPPRRYLASKRDRFGGITLFSGPAAIVAAELARPGSEYEEITPESAAKIIAASRRYAPGPRPRPLRIGPDMYALYLDLPPLDVQIPARPVIVRPRARRAA